MADQKRDIPQRGVPRDRHLAKEAAGQKSRRKRRRNRTLYYLFAVFLVVIVGGTLSLTVFFNATDILVTGMDEAFHEGIIASSGLKKGNNLFRIQPETARQNVLAQNIWVDDVRVQRKLPATLVIECVPAVVTYSLADPQPADVSLQEASTPEEVPQTEAASEVAASEVAGLEVGGPETAPADDQETYFYLSASGRILDIGPPDPGLACQRISGLEPASRELGGYAFDVKTAERIQQVNQTMRDNGLTDDMELDFRPAGGAGQVDLQVIYQGRLVIKLSNLSDLSYQVQGAAALIRDHIRPHERGVIQLIANKFHFIPD